MTNGALVICGDKENGYQIFYMVFSPDGQTCTPYLYEKVTHKSELAADIRLANIRLSDKMMELRKAA